MPRRLTKQQFGWLLTTIALGGCDVSFNHMYTAVDKNRTYPTNGEQIYFTGRSLSGSPITYQGGHMHARMHLAACADCHGVQQEGGQRMYPIFWLTAPPLTREALFSAHEDEHEEKNEHGDHQAYTRVSLKKAITAGVDPSGEPLDSAMPRWQMSESDLEDLVDYLAAGTLDATEHARGK
ncbi:c-type cytochrome [Photobacterium sp. MCCC 1A19761]|uniref:c-type cytochrome n=1 Tax=Photobacterium sp. MCCC 1A19761 TaxID=3115000 RepID=UPI00307D6A93